MMTIMNKKKEFLKIKINKNHKIIQNKLRNLKHRWIKI